LQNFLFEGVVGDVMDMFTHGVCLRGDWSAEGMMMGSGI